MKSKEEIESEFLQEGKDECIRIAKKYTLYSAHRNGFYDGHLEDDILSALDDYQKGFGTDYAHHYAHWYHNKINELNKQDNENNCNKN